MWILITALSTFVPVSVEAAPADHYKKARQIAADPTLSKEKKQEALKKSLAANWGRTFGDYFRKINPTGGSRKPRTIQGDGFKDFRPMNDKEKVAVQKELSGDVSDLPEKPKASGRPQTVPRAPKRREAPAALDGSAIPRFLEFPGRKE